MASWWDYGYQTTAMANRTVIVDNNTWNNTHIATVGGGVRCAPQLTSLARLSPRRAKHASGTSLAACTDTHALLAAAFPTAQVGRAMASPERKAWQIFRSLDVEYVFVVFGGFIG